MPKLWKTLAAPFSRFAVSDDGDVVGPSGPLAGHQSAPDNPVIRYNLRGDGGARQQVSSLAVVALAFTEYGTTPNHDALLVMPLNGDGMDVRPENVSLRKGPRSKGYTVPEIDYTGASLEPFGPPYEPETDAQTDPEWVWFEDPNPRLDDLLEAVGTLLEDNRTIRAEIAKLRKSVATVANQYHVNVTTEKGGQLTMFGSTPVEEPDEPELDPYDYLTVREYFEECGRETLIGSAVAQSFGRAAAQKARDNKIGLEVRPAPPGVPYDTINAYPRWLLNELP